MRKNRFLSWGPNLQPVDIERNFYPNSFVHFGTFPAKEVGRLGRGTLKGENMKAKNIQQAPRTPIDLWRMMGGQAQRVKSATGTDSMLAIYQDRLTYTFILDNEVASIHYDRRKREIFFKGQNIKHLELSMPQKKVLEGLKGILVQEERGKLFAAEYGATLAKQFAH